VFTKYSFEERKHNIGNKNKNLHKVLYAQNSYCIEVIKM
jgi:hypothetical protein